MAEAQEVPRRPSVSAKDNPHRPSVGAKDNPHRPSVSGRKYTVSMTLPDQQSADGVCNVTWLLNHLGDIVSSRRLTAPFRRQTHQRVFVNRALQLDKIKFIGFDMDYTLAEYQSPDYETLSFELTVNRLINVLGYPAAIATKYPYDPSFGIRGLWFDKIYGNLLKVDQFGNIMHAFHGFKEQRNHKILELYPNKFVNYESQRIYVLNTLFEYSESFLLACLIDYFDSSADAEVQATGVKNGDLFITYKSVFNDVRTSIEVIHKSGELQRKTLENLPKYVPRDPRLGTMLQRLRLHAKVFLLTNSPYKYTDAIMKFMLEDPAHPDVKWISFFDYVVVDSGKPLFFEEGTLMRQVDMTTGSLAIGRHVGPLRPGQVYSGGNCDTFSDLIGAKGRDVLYVGDHIFGDILRSKKKRGWRTYLVVPELHQELLVWTEKRELFERLTHLDMLLADAYKHLDSSAVTLDASQVHEIELIKKASRHVSREMDMAYGVLGSTFRSGARQTFFANQVQRYADLYATSCINLLHYPYSYFFKASPVLLPHEATVDHHASYFPMQNSADAANISEERPIAFPGNLARLQRSLSVGLGSPPRLSVLDQLALEEAMGSDEDDEASSSSADSQRNADNNRGKSEEKP